MTLSNDVKGYHLQDWQEEYRENLKQLNSNECNHIYVTRGDSYYDYRFLMLDRIGTGVLEEYYDVVKQSISEAEFKKARLNADKGAESAIFTVLNKPFTNHNVKYPCYPCISDVFSVKRLNNLYDRANKFFDIKDVHHTFSWDNYGDCFSLYFFDYFCIVYRKSPYNFEDCILNLVHYDGAVFDLLTRYATYLTKDLEVPVEIGDTCYLLKYEFCSLSDWKYTDDYYDEDSGETLCGYVNTKYPDNVFSRKLKDDFACFTKIHENCFVYYGGGITGSKYWEDFIVRYIEPEDNGSKAKMALTCNEDSLKRIVEKLSNGLCVSVEIKKYKEVII